eukprot:6352526-Prymnesium_polylepis.1
MYRMRALPRGGKQARRRSRAGRQTSKRRSHARRQTAWMDVSHVKIGRTAQTPSSPLARTRQCRAARTG